MSRPDQDLTMIVKTIPPDLLKKIPSIAPPPGQSSNFVDPPTFQTAFIIGITTGSFFMLSAVGLRIYSKIIGARMFGWDDVTCFLATLMSIAYSAMTLYSTQLGYGIHEWNVSLYALLRDEFHKVALYQMCSVTPLLLSVKLSLFFLYLRLFETSRKTRILSLFGIVVCSIFYTFGFVYPLAVCSPRHGQLRAAAIATKKCDRMRTFSWVQIPFNIITDFYLVLIPIPVVRKLQMAKAKKLRVILIFACGIFGCICGVVNGYYRVILSRTQDLTFYSGVVFLVSGIEINVGIVAGCMPVIQPSIISRVVRLVDLRLFLSRFSSKSNLSGPESSNAGAFRQKSPNCKPYLETHILNGADGSGKFLETANNPTSNRSTTRANPWFQSRIWAPGNDTTAATSWFQRSIFASRGGRRKETTNMMSTTASAAPIAGVVLRGDPGSGPSSSSSDIIVTSTGSTSDGLKGDDQDLHRQYLQGAEKERNMI